MKIPSHWLVKENGQTLIEQRLFHSRLRPMPPNSPLLKEQAVLIKTWLKQM